VDFLDHWKGGMVFYNLPSLLLNKNCKSCVSLKKCKSQGKAKAVEVTLNNKEENFQDFCLYFVQEFGLWCCCLTCVLCTPITLMASQGHLSCRNQRACTVYSRLMTGRMRLHCKKLPPFSRSQPGRHLPNSPWPGIIKL